MLDTPRERIDELLDHARALVRRPWARIIKSSSGSGIGSARRACFFAHYHRYGRIGVWTQHYLRELRRLGFSTSVISTAPHLDPTDLSATAPLCDTILHRENTGYDFGSWRTGLDHAGYRLMPAATVLICNDSVLGPFVDLEPIFTQFEASGDAVWGLTDNSEIRPHLQSYFLLVRGDTFTRPAFRRFWSTIRMKSNKEGIVLRYEIGFTDLLRKTGLPWRAAFPLAKVLEHSGWHPRPTDTDNQTLFLWDTLLREYSFPVSQDHPPATLYGQHPRPDGLEGFGPWHARVVA